MPRGGARAGAGPDPDPTSARQKRLKAKADRDALSGATVVKPSPLGHRFGRLPRAGYSGRIPAWPLSSPATPAERKVWNEAWRTPQAQAWITEPWRWRTVALWARASVRCEDPDAAPAIFTAATRLADQVGLTPSGLRANGWEIEEAPGTRAEELVVAAETTAKIERPLAPAVDPRDRLKVVPNDAGG